MTALTPDAAATERAHQARLERCLHTLADSIRAQLPGEARLSSPDGTFFIVRHDAPNLSSHCFEKPLASLVVQGSKRTLVGTREYTIREGQSMVAVVDMPSVTLRMEATAQRPFLSVYFQLDSVILSDLIRAMPTTPRAGSSSHPGQSAQAADGEQTAEERGAAQGVSVMDATADFADAMLRMVRLMADTPKRALEARLLAPIVLRELHCLLLLGPQGAVLHDAYLSGSKNNQVLDVIALLRRTLSRPLRMEEMARHAHMSVSSLHRHFKRMTGFSPLQFHKQLRLHEAQRLMLAENERAAVAALAVGYESVTQFTREYKRMFGEPPRRDIARRRG